MSETADYLLFPEFRLSVANKIPIKFLSHDNLSIETMMDFILRGKLPVPKVRSFADDVERLFADSKFTSMSSVEKLKFLEEKYPDFRNWFESVIAGEGIWRSVIEREYSTPGFNQNIKRIVDFFSKQGYTSPESLREISLEISQNFKISKYKIRAKLEGSIDNLFDSLNITDKCRQIVLVKPLESRVQYKLSNKFGDRMTKVHSQRSLIDLPSRKNRLNNYIGMTFTKNKGSSKVVSVFIEERVPKTPFDEPILEIIFENLEDVDGEVVLKYFVQTISDISARGKKLKETIARLRYDVFDVEIITSMYNKDFVRHALIELSSRDPIHEILFNESKTRVDDQRFCLRSLLGKIRSRVDFQEKFIVFGSNKDIFEIFDLISLFLSYTRNKSSIDILGLGQLIPKLADRISEIQESRYEMDIIEIQEGGERVLRKAKFFDSVFNKVCNKPENVPIFGESLDTTKEGVVYDFFPPERLIRKLTDSGRFEFPKYQTQRIPVQTFYGEAARGKKSDKVRILGRRKIPRERRDEMAVSENLAYIFGYFPCVVTMKKTEYEKIKGRTGPLDDVVMKDDEDEVDEEEIPPGGGEHIYDETKDEIPLGRVAKTQLFFFDALKSSNTMDILRTGVLEGPTSFFTAVGIASGGDLENKTVEKLVIEEIDSNPKIIQAGIAQFPDSKNDEIKKFIVESSREFMDSKYLINIVGEYFDVNVIVMEYNQIGSGSTTLDYALYECPRGTIPPNIFEQLNMDRKTVILLRRKYQALYDQYDFLIEREPKGTKVISRFDTAKVKEFLKSKLSFVDLVPEVVSRGGNTKIVDLSRKHFALTDDDPLKEVFQVIDSVGARVGTVFSTENALYPCIHLYPLSPSVGLQVVTFNELLEYERPSIDTIALDLGITEFLGVGETRAGKSTYVTSVLNEEIIFLCHPTILDDRLSMLFRNSTNIETPDPYIARQFTSNPNTFTPQTILRKRRFAEIVTYFLLQVVFTEMLERYVVKNSFETSSYSTWRKNLLKLETSNVPDSDSISEVLLDGFIGEIKTLNGFIPPSAISWFQTNKQRYSRISTFFNGGSSQIRCFSAKMLERMESQVMLLEKIIPTIGVKTIIPKSVYRIRGLYETLDALSQSPESVNGVEESRGTDRSYVRWQEKCKTSFENTNIYEGIYKPFFNVPKDQPLIGFHGNNGGSGLWVIQSNPDTDTVSYPIFGNTLPRITYLKEKTFGVFLPDDPDNRLQMKKLT